MSNGYPRRTFGKRYKAEKIDKLPLVIILFVLVAVFICITFAYAGNNPLRAGSDDDPASLMDNAAVDTFPDETLVSDSNPPPDPDAPHIYLTFDDGPSTESTQKILDILDTYDIKATFFEIGNQAENLPDIVRLVDSRGHVIANHGYSHNYDKVYASSEAFMTDIEKCEAVLTDILGRAPVRILRFPAGTAAEELENDPAMRDEIKQILESGGWRYFDWDASMRDSISGSVPKSGSLGKKLNKTLDSLVAEGYTDIVVLAHDTDSRPWTPNDLPLVIEHCKDKGYVFDVLTLDSPPCAYR